MTTTRKKRKAVEEEMPTSEPGQLIYVGPTILDGLLQQNALFIGGVPLQYEDLLKEQPDIELLIVPVAQLVETNRLTQIPGTPQHAVYQRLQKGA
ncbi:hypothetical protein SAMN05216312_102217 [Cohnella sp. OV330]|uniref:hypothetical protein n=1 Tax=Cohnella sp. OV330 TaxID=1855288 RepID=UPI0008E6F52B|nr:hypothetical protein [Cohnella sp. OV330]SFA91584.1 hypothetical protein SAMN05216312_102217 [Cohnella sp. OV330]